MRRFSLLSSRPHWEQIIADENLTYDMDHDDPEDTEHYWNEFDAYAFSPLEVEDIKAQVQQLHTMCIEAIDYIASGAFGHLGLPQEFFALAVKSWEQHKENPAREMDFYGRFDVVYQPDTGFVKLLEYNADTPTGMVEAAVCQTSHFDYHFGHDARYAQCNFIGDAFIERWREILAARTDKRGYVDNNIYFTSISPEHDELQEDEVNTRLIAHCAQMAGWNTHYIYLEDIEFNEQLQRFEAADGMPIHTIFKLYPWEDIALDEFGGFVEQTYDSVSWFEPAWKMFLSNKMLLAALWKLFPDHPNLVPAYVGSPEDLTHYVVKPIFGREGDGVAVFKDGVLVDGHPDETPAHLTVFQQLVDLVDFPDERGSHIPVIGAWVVGGQCVGFGIRESASTITDYYCQFTPTVVEQF